MPQKPKVPQDSEQQERERGKSIPLYTRKVAKALVGKKTSGKLTPSKRA